MDTALTYTYEKTTPLQITYEDVTIYEKKDDPSSALRFWESFYHGPSSYYDIMYPAKGAEQFLVNFQAVDGKGNSSYTTQFSDTLQKKLDFLDASYYHINMQDSFHFDLSFPKTQPSFYKIELVADNFEWNIQLPATKTTFNGTNQLIDLSKSILLHGMNNSKLHFGALLLANSDNMDYNNYYNFIFASDAPGKNKLHEWQYCLIEKP